MNNNDLRRHSDYADMPRTLAWFIIGVKEIGIVSVVVGFLLWYVYSTQTQFTTLVRQTIESVDKNTTALNGLKHFLTKKYDD